MILSGSGPSPRRRRQLDALVAWRCETATRGAVPRAVRPLALLEWTDGSAHAARSRGLKCRSVDLPPALIEPISSVAQTCLHGRRAAPRTLSRGTPGTRPGWRLSKLLSRCATTSRASAWLIADQVMLSETGGLFSNKGCCCGRYLHDLRNLPEPASRLCGPFQRWRRDLRECRSVCWWYLAAMRRGFNGCERQKRQGIKKPEPQPFGSMRRSNPQSSWIVSGYQPGSLGRSPSDTLPADS